MGRKNEHWLRLSGGYVVQFGRARTRKGVRYPPRFIVLQPMAAPRTFRKILCAGYVDGGELKLDHGLLDETIAAAVLERFAVWRNTP